MVFSAVDLLLMAGSCLLSTCRQTALPIGVCFRKDIHDVHTKTLVFLDSIVRHLDDFSAISVEFGDN